MKFLKGRLLAIIVLAIASATIIGLLFIGRSYPLKLIVYYSPSSILEGDYSIDDGPWTKFDYHEPINERFRKIVSFAPHLFGQRNLYFE